ncbi:phosphatase PAP2 family protein [Microseira wollei]|uniref:Phosphoesterase, PA-phosphatase related n=1 Tax=Microseira wollei NIES-4236 TaxID=2530354 RepID=A0AAV3WF20_9CYAN|nr:phosphatase PAP2 family protein [Microseira wollei]GET36159.1 phosphoesterase, PA-phosphatase related [Microseira wollei NIES-4236]
MLQSDSGNIFLSFLNFFKRLLVAHWLTLLLLLIGIYLPLQVFEILAVKVWQNQGGFPWDVPILLSIHTTTQAQLDIFAATLTKFASSKIIIPVVSLIALVLLLCKQWRRSAYLIATVWGSLIINRAAKEFMHRVRPHLWDSPAPEIDYAFPSGHATMSMTLVMALVILTWGTAWCWLIATVGSLFVVGIAWTRLYLGVHFPSDILAGWMVSVAWAIGVSLILKPGLVKANALNNQTGSETSLTPDEASK